jgi:hypothetical protein
MRRRRPAIGERLTLQRISWSPMFTTIAPSVILSVVHLSPVDFLGKGKTEAERKGGQGGEDEPKPKSVEIERPGHTSRPSCPGF